MILVGLDALADTIAALRVRVAAHFHLQNDPPPLDDLDDPAGWYPEEHYDAAAAMMRLEASAGGPASAAAAANPHPHALDAMQALVRRKLVHAVITDRRGAALAAGRAWLQRVGLDTLPLEIAGPDPRHGVYLGQTLKADRARVVIDTDPRIAHAAVNAGAPVILLDAPYNQRFEHPLVTRAYSWRGIGALILALPLDTRKDRRGF